ncbi:MAG: hypothetical protein J5988_06535 [Eubacterium sp.]|nr:hypothetical protein [Eubacterium sp.]
MELKITAVVTAILVFIALVRFFSCHPEKLILKQYEELSGFIREKQRESTMYGSIQEKLTRNGAEYHYGKWITPMGYIVMRLFCGMAGMAILGRVSFGFGVVTSMLLFFLPDWLLIYLNGQDNIRLLPEIKLVYHALEIQIKAGVYVTDALAECYGSVKEKRLQQALLDLAGSIVIKSDIYEAMDAFQKKFDNRYVDALCITILQACESGQAVEVLGDIGEQLKDMETAVMNSKKSSLDRSVTFYQLGMVAAVLAVIIYACVSYLFSSAVNL